MVTHTLDSVQWQLGADAASAVRIDSGALVAGKAQGRRFGSDTIFDGGKAGTIDTPPTTARRPSARRWRTPRSGYVATYREGNFGCRVPLENGRYDVTLTFMESSAQPGERRFDVLAGDKRVIRGWYDQFIAGMGCCRDGASSANLMKEAHELRNDDLDRLLLATTV